MNNLITIAVTENRPELITSNRNFNVNSLITEGCGLTHFRNIIEEKFTPLACRGLSCKSCPFGYKEPDSNNTDNQTIKSMKQWLKLEPLEQSTQSITYSEEEVYQLYKQTCERLTNCFVSYDVEWFNNHKKK